MVSVIWNRLRPVNHTVGIVLNDESAPGRSRKIGSLPVNNHTEIVPAHNIAPLIRCIRAAQVILDTDLAGLYGVLTKRLNEQYRRNLDRFPEDFAFQLTQAEWTTLKSQFATSCPPMNRSQFATGSQKHRDPRYLPYPFTEHGALMAANILNSPRAVAMSVYVIC